VVLTRLDTARLFFAAWPAPEIQQALGKRAQELARECGGRAIPAHNIHLTLVFLGDVERTRRAQIDSLAGSISARRFDLAVDRVEYWRHNRIIWAGVERCPEALQDLVAGLQRALAVEKFRVEGRPHVPHITLLRDARRAPGQAALPGIAWPVTRFALVESVVQERGRVYQVLREWLLSVE
jgi:2'-5' RNA ligase